MFEGARDRKIKFRLSALADQQPVSPTIEKCQRDFTGHIQRLMLILNTSPTGRALLRNAIENQVSIGLDVLLEPSSNFFYPAQKHFDFGYQPEMLQKTEKGQGRYLVSFIGGLRRAWHSLAGNGADISLKPGDFLRQCRCEEADIEAITHLIGWELRAAGHGFFWRYLLSEANGDMAVVFERTAEEDPHALFDGRALKAAFNQWFGMRERANACDRFALEIIDMTILQQEHLTKIGTRTLRQEQVERVGILPDGRNYLLGCLCMGGWYDGLDDLLNREHLKSLEREIIQLIENKEKIHKQHSN